MGYNDCHSKDGFTAWYVGVAFRGIFSRPETNMLGRLEHTTRQALKSAFSWVGKERKGLFHKTTSRSKCGQRAIDLDVELEMRVERTVEWPKSRAGVAQTDLARRIQHQSLD